MWPTARAVDAALVQLDAGTTVECVEVSLVRDARDTLGTKKLVSYLLLFMCLPHKI